MEKEIKFKFSNWENFDGIYEESEGEYVFISDLRVGYFVTNFRFFRRYGLIWISTIFPLTIFGQFREFEGNLIIEYKITLRLALLIGTCILSWFYLPFKANNITTLIAALIGASLTFLVVYVIFIFKKMKMILIAGEIKKLLKLKE